MKLKTTPDTIPSEVFAARVLAKYVKLKLGEYPEYQEWFEKYEVHGGMIKILAGFLAAMKS